MTDRGDRLLGVLAGDDGAVRLLHVDRRELDELVHPVWPEMLGTAGFVVTENAGGTHGRSIRREAPQLSVNRGPRLFRE